MPTIRFLFSFWMVAAPAAHADHVPLAFRGDVLAVRNTLIDCRQRAKSAAAHITCFKRATPDLMRIFEDYFNERKTPLDPARVARLDRAQTIWELFRDHECDDAAAVTDDERLESYRCLWDETHARLYEVEKRTRTQDW